MRKFILLALFAATNSAIAQQAGTPTEQALGIKLSNEISLGLQCSASVITGQQEAEKLKARIKALEEKYEPKDKKQ